MPWVYAPVEAVVVAVAIVGVGGRSRTYRIEGGFS